MKHALLIIPKAGQDIEEIMAFYGGEDDDLSSRFMIALRKCFRDLQDNPYLSTPYLREEVRRVFLLKWPYHVYFRIADTQVRVQAIIHTSRDPRYISKRTRNAR